MSLEQDRRITEVVRQEQSRLRNFIRRRVPDPRDAEDILQDVFYKLVEANRLLMPIDHVTGWLFRVARNRITDLFRKKQPESFSDAAVAGDDGESLQFEDLLPSPDAGKSSNCSDSPSSPATAASLKLSGCFLRKRSVMRLRATRNSQPVTCSIGISRRFASTSS